MFNVISLQELKRTGFQKLKQMFNDEPDIIVQERGHDACVLVETEYYNYLKACELEMALAKAKSEIEAGKYISGANEHINLMKKKLKNTKVQVSNV